MEVEVTAGELKEINMNLNAGYLKMRAILKEGGKPVEENMEWRVYKPEKDINGKREEVASFGEAEPLFKLSAGRYYIVAEYGNDNIIASMEVKVAAGECNETTLNLSQAE
jgi:hypothetical protein